MFRTFADWREHLARTRARKLGRNTYLETDPDGTIGVRFHATRILTWRPDGAVIYQSGGYRTVTTLARMNEWGPGEVRQIRGVWYYRPRGAGQDTAYAYADGLTIRPDGTPDPETLGPDPRAMLRLRASVTRYAREFVAELYAGRVPAPGPGDCFYCLMRDESGVPLGEQSRDPEHVLSHIAEKYYVPSLLLRACETEGSRVLMWGLAADWASDDKARESGRAWRRDGLQPSYARAVRRYVLRQLGGSLAGAVR